MIRRMPRAAAVALALVVVLAGCAAIPTDGGVGTSPVHLDEGGDDLLTIAEGPQPGASPMELLAGFLVAQRAPQNNYSVAREYLTPEFRSVWSPTARVLISDSRIAPQQLADDEFEVSVSVQAVVTPAGAYSELQRPEAHELPYRFEQNDQGEWRISFAEDGLLLSNADFGTSFDPFSLYFYDPGFTALVPDVRWFPKTTSQADRIVKELLAGPSPWYGNGVLLTAFPTGTTLDAGVSITAGTATVDLSGSIASQDQPARWRMQRQLRQSLIALSEVSAVQLSSGGFPIEVGDGPEPETAFLVRSDPLGVAADGGFGYLSRSAVDPVGGISPAVESLGALGATLARGGQSAAVRNARGAWLVKAGADPLLLDTRPGVIDPSIDTQGYLWSAVGADADSIVAIDAAGGRHPLAAPNLDGAIVALDVSRDGTRLLIATQGAGGPGLTVAGILRGGDGVPTGLGEPLSLTIADAPLLDATWVDSSTVATLSRGAETTRIDTYRIGGRHESLGLLAGGVQIVGGNLADGIRVRDADGGVWRRTSSGGWQPTGVVASFLATQQ